MYSLARDMLRASDLVELPLERVRTMNIGGSGQRQNGQSEAQGGSRLAGSAALHTALLHRSTLRKNHQNSSTSVDSCTNTGETWKLNGKVMKPPTPHVGAGLRDPERAERSEADADRDVHPIHLPASSTITRD